MVKACPFPADPVPVATGDDLNFQPRLQFSDVDLRQAETDTVSFTQVIGQTTAEDAWKLKAKLNSMETLSFQGSFYVAVDAAKCPNIRYMCFDVGHSRGTAGYPEVTYTNNLFCVDVQSKMSCIAGEQSVLVMFNVLHTMCNPNVVIYKSC